MPRLTAGAPERLGQELGKHAPHRPVLRRRRDNPYGAGAGARLADGLRRHPDAESPPSPRSSRSTWRGPRRRGGTASAARRHPRGPLHGQREVAGERVGAFFDFEMACRGRLRAGRGHHPERLVLRRAATARALCGLPAAATRCSARWRRPSARASMATPLRRGALHRQPHPRLPPLAAAARQARPKDFRTYLARARALAAMGPEGFLALLGL